VRFRIDGFLIGETIEGKTPDIIIQKLRDAIASKIPHIPFTKKDDHLRESLDVDGRDDWTDEEFRKFIIDYYNQKMRKQSEPQVPLPKDNRELIQVAVRLKMARILVPEVLPC
jgi:hypothetical protein